MNENYYSLLNKKKAGDSTIDRARIYFAAHPDDTDSFLEPMFNELQNIHSCTFYYFNPDAIDPRTDEELLEKHQADLREMQLVIVPVTEKFLTEPSLARDHDISFAISCNIPLLPVMQGSNLLDLYNEVEALNGIHFFDKNTKDSSALSYEEKLKRFIEAVLVNDSHLSEIHDEFSKRIFLSYRKIDRIFAQKLMQKIHSLEGCRDVAIWYDEFLTPGEQFNEEIEGRIAACDLFAMVITPNIAIKPNYVEENEYRSAIENGKSILATEFVGTSRKSLDDAFERLPECIDFEDEKKILETLKEYDIGNSPLPEDSNHLFLIGLAYLNGIQVETDRTRAVQLITEAAEKSDDPHSILAIKKLSEMYHFGIGVPRNFENAHKWQLTLVKKYEALLTEYKKEAPVDALNDMTFLYIYEYITLGDYCYEENDVKRCEAYYEDIGDALLALVTGSEGKQNHTLDGITLSTDLALKIWADCSRGFTRLSLYAHKNNDPQKAEYYLDCEEKIDDAVSEMMAASAAICSMDQDEVKKKLNILIKEQIHNEKGYKRCWNAEKYDDAAQYCLNNAKLNENFLEELDKAGVNNEDIIANCKSSLVAWYSRAGNVMYQAGSYSNCIDYLSKSLTYYEELGGKLDAFNDEVYYMDIWIDYLMMGQSMVFMMDQNAAVKYLRRAFDVCSEIYEKIPTKQWLNNLNNTKERLNNQERLNASSFNFWNMLANMVENDEEEQPAENSSSDNSSENKASDDIEDESDEKPGYRKIGPGIYELIRDEDEEDEDEANEDDEYDENGNKKFRLSMITREELADKSIDQIIELYKENMSEGDRALSLKKYSIAESLYNSCITCEEEILERRNSIYDKWYYAFALEGKATTQMQTESYSVVINTYDKVAVLCTEVLKKVDCEDALVTLAKSFSNIAIAASKLNLGTRVSDKFFKESKKVWKKAWKKYRKPEYKANMIRIDTMKQLFR